TVSLFFLRFWKSTGDRFFLFFSLAFAIEAVSRLLLGLSNYSSEYEPMIYLMRLVAFLVIIGAIVDKNRVKKP
ncbi:MAG TPA: DUF5985 family protein, partial [Micavibrio sp.]